MSFREAIERQRNTPPLPSPQIVYADLRSPEYILHLMEMGLKVLNKAKVPDILEDLVEYLISEGINDARLGYPKGSAKLHSDSGLVTMGALWNFRKGVGINHGHAWYGVSVSSILSTEDLLVNRTDQCNPNRVSGEVLKPEVWSGRANLENVLARAYRREPHFTIPNDYIPDQTYVAKVAHLLT